MTSKQYINSLKIVHIGMVLSQFVLAGAMIFVKTQEDPELVPDPSEERLFFYLTPIAAICGVVIGFMVYRNRINSAMSSTQLSKKLEYYRTAVILRFALMEMPSILAIVAFFLTKNFLFLAVSAFIVMILAMLHPNRQKMYETLGLNTDEIRTMDNPDAEVLETKISEDI